MAPERANPATATLFGEAALPAGGFPAGVCDGGEMEAGDGGEFGETPEEGDGVEGGGAEGGGAGGEVAGDEEGAGVGAAGAFGDGEGAGDVGETEGDGEGVAAGGGDAGAGENRGGEAFGAADGAPPGA